jgi:hypothetical protein
MNRLLEQDWRGGMNSLPGERRIHHRGIPFRPAPDDGKIFLCDALLLHHQAKAPRRGGVLRHEHEAAGFPIEPVHDRNLSAIRDLEGEQLFQFSPECARPSWLGGMNEQEWRLLDDNEIIAFRRDGEAVYVICASRVRGG